MSKSTTTLEKTTAKRPPRAKAKTAKVEAVADNQWQLTLTKPRVLQAVPTPVFFDPSNKAHREAFANFLVNQKWPEGVRFHEEWPHTSAVTTIQTKLVEYALRNEIPAVKATKLALKNMATTTTAKEGNNEIPQ